MFAGGLNKKLDLWSGSQHHRHYLAFFDMPDLHRRGATLFKRLFRKPSPFCRLLRHAGDTEDTFSTKPPGPHDGKLYFTLCHYVY